MARPIVRIVLPLTALILGLVFFIFGIFSWRAPLLVRGEMLAGGGAAATAGFLTLYWGIRAHFNADPQVRASAAIRSDIGVGALFVLIGLLVVGSATSKIQADFGPAQAHEVRIAQVVRISGRGSHGADFRIEGQRGWLQWRCEFDCAPRDSLLQVRPGPARMTTIGSRLIGLDVDGAGLLNIEAERQRLQRSDAFLWALGAAMALAATFYTFRRDRALRELAPGPRIDLGPTVQRAWGSRKEDQL